MSDAENFDEHIRNEFSNFIPEVPSRIWDNIIAERERRKPAGFWFSLFNNKASIWAGIIAIGIVSVLLLTKSNGSLEELNQQKITAPSTTSDSQQNSAGELKEINKAVENSTTTISTESNTQKTISLKNVTETGNTTTASSSENNNSSEKTAALKNTVKANRLKNSSIISNTIKADKNIIDTKSINNINEGADGTSSSTSQQNKSVVNNSLYKKSKRKLSSFSYKNNAGAFVDNGATEGEEDSYATNDNLTKNNYFNFLSLPQYSSTSVEKNSMVMNYNLSLKKKSSPDFTLPECPSIEKDAAGNKRYFEIYIGPDYGVRTLTDTANSVYLQKRKESSGFTSGYSAGVRYTKVFDNGMSVRAALNYSQINEKFTYIQGNIVQVTYTIDPATGDTTGSYTVTGSRYKTSSNAYRSIDIPLTIGYELGNGKIHANINAGVVANIYSWQKGDILDTNFKPVDITTGKGSSYYQFKTNVGLGVIGGASIYYKINEQLHFLVEPYVRYNFQSMGTTNLSVQQKYTTIGLRLGLRFDIP